MECFYIFLTIVSLGHLAQAASITSKFGISKDCGESFCVPISYCKPVCDDLLQMDTNQQVRHQILDLHCGFYYSEPLVCCPGLKKLPSSPVCDVLGDKKNKSKPKNKIPTNDWPF
jgi:hypothetical protein